MEQLPVAPLLTPDKPAPSPQRTPAPTATVADRRSPVGGNIRIFQDGLLIARCSVRSIAPARLFASIDPLHFPVNTLLEIEFVSDDLRTTGTPRLSATVMHRSLSGIELRTGSDIQALPAPCA